MGWARRRPDRRKLGLHSQNLLPTRSMLSLL